MFLITGKICLTAQCTKLKNFTFRVYTISFPNYDFVFSLGWHTKTSFYLKMAAHAFPGLLNCCCFAEGSILKLAVDSCTVFCESQLSVSKTSYIDFGTALKHRFTYPTFMVYTSLICLRKVRRVWKHCGLYLLVYNTIQLEIFKRKYG